MSRFLSGLARAIRLVPILILAAGALGATSSPATASTQTAGCTGSWEIVPAPSPGSVGNTLSDVVALTSTDAWAVGSKSAVVDDQLTQRSMALHWDGRAWTEAPTPPIDGSALAGVFALAPDDVWAVGSVLEELLGSRPLIEHYDGAAWTVVPSPQIEFGNLFAISGTSPTDLWAVGTVRNPVHMLIEHYDGQRWRIVRSPNIQTDFVSLEGVTAISPTDVWAAGYFLAHTFGNAPLVVHFDGAAWSLVSTPEPGDEGSELYDIAGSASDSVWAVGRTTSDAGTQPLAMRWNGTVWTIPAPAIGEAAHFNGVALRPGGNPLAVGQATGMGGTQRTLTEVFRGGSWKVVPSPNAGSQDNILFDAAVTDGVDEAWAVGTYNPHGLGKTLVERICR
jgi:hypothetical protein